MRLWLVGLAVALIAAITVGVLVIVTATASETLVLDLDVGDCFDIDLEPDVDGPTAAVDTVDTVDCDGPHVAEVAAVGELDPEGALARPADDEAFAMADAGCSEMLAGRASVLERFGIAPVVADEGSWDAFDGRYVCLLIPYGGEPTRGSVLD